MDGEWRMFFAKQYWRNRFDWKIYPSFWLLATLTLLIWPAYRFLPAECGYENGLIENTQMAVLAAAIGIGFFARKYRPLFLFAGMIFFVLMLREVNFGKTIFYPDPVTPNKFLPWSKIWYAPYVDPVMIAYGVGVAVFFLVKKVYLQIFDTLLHTRIPVWHVLFLFAGGILGPLRTRSSTATFWRNRSNWSSTRRSQASSRCTRSGSAPEFRTAEKRWKNNRRS